jgi:2',3'-cyclic-nucleotide 2'-phosphodiesterase (5'-nucleotidase family)
MKKIFTSFWIIISLLFLQCASHHSQNYNDDANIRVQLVQLNDVYEIAPLEGGKTGGMARVATIVDSLRQINPNTLLFMAGDFLNPSLLGTLKINGERIRGRQMVEVMNAMKFDLVAFGNHEFDLKYKDLQKRLDESDFDWILGNAKLHQNDKDKAFYKSVGKQQIPVPQTKILHLKDSDGTELNIGFFSEIVDSNPKDYVRYSDPFIQAKKDIEQLKNKGADIILGLTHLNKEQDLKILEQNKEVPLIMGGHEHYNMLLTASTGGKVAKADANAKTVYLHTLTYNKKKQKLSIDSKLILINEKIQESEKIALIVEKWQKILRSSVKKVADNPEDIVMITKEPLDAREKSIRHHQTNFGKLVTDAMLAASHKQAVAAIVNSGSIRIDDKLSGELVALDFFRALPFGGSIYDVRMKGGLLTDVLNYGEKHKGKGSYLQRSANLKQLSGGVWAIDGTPIQKDEIYNIMVSDYLMKGYDIPILKETATGVIEVDKPLAKDDIRKDIRSVIIHYLKTRM